MKKPLLFIVIVAIIYFVLAWFIFWWPFIPADAFAVVIKKNDVSGTFSLIGNDQKGAPAALIENIQSKFQSVDKDAMPVVWFFNRQDQRVYISSVIDSEQEENVKIVTATYSYNLKKDRLSKSSIPLSFVVSDVYLTKTSPGGRQVARYGEGSVEVFDLIEDEIIFSYKPIKHVIGRYVKPEEDKDHPDKHFRWPQEGLLSYPLYELVEGTNSEYELTDIGSIGTLQKDMNK